MLADLSNGDLNSAEKDHLSNGDLMQQEEPLEVDFLPFVEVDFICFSQQQEGGAIIECASIFGWAYIRISHFTLQHSCAGNPAWICSCIQEPAFIPQILSMDQPNEWCFPLRRWYLYSYKPCGGETITNLGQIGLKRQTMTHNGLRSLNKLDMLQMKKNAKAIAKHASNKNGPKTENDRPSSTIIYGSGMNIVFVGAEVGPWSKTGGLGDVLGGLPPAMAQWASCYDSFPTLRPVQRCMGYSFTKADKKDVVGLQEQVFVRKALKEAFEVFCNKGVGGSSSAELLATFCDNILKKGGSEKLSDEAIEETLEKVVKLLAYISDKDLFVEFYRKKLARRLLFDKSANDEHERSILTKLKQQCGGQFTSKMEGMVTDLTLARENQTNFEEYLKTNPDASPGIDLTVTVLTTGFWPSYKSFDLNLPVEMCVEVFREFYQTKTKHRKVTWIYSLGTCNLNGKFEPKTMELIVTTYQASVLLLFNALGRLSYQEIMTQLNLTNDDVLEKEVTPSSKVRADVVRSGFLNTQKGASDGCQDGNKVSGQLHRYEHLSRMAVIDESESLSDIDDVEVDKYLHSKEEMHYKKIIWEQMNSKHETSQGAENANTEGIIAKCDTKFNKKFSTDRLSLK
ncbi:unnamed protein product [Camellia sinensis]